MGASTLTSALMKEEGVSQFLTKDGSLCAIKKSVDMVLKSWQGGGPNSEIFADVLHVHGPQPKPLSPPTSEVFLPTQ